MAREREVKTGFTDGKMCLLFHLLYRRAEGRASPGHQP